MFRKITAILLTIAMLFSISLCACAEENGQPPEPPSGDMAPPDGGNGQPPERPDDGIHIGQFAEALTRSIEELDQREE